MSQKRPHPTTGEEEGKKKKPEEEKKQQDKAMASSSDPSVFCDVCAERKEKAVKSCLMCPSSYCETHLETHHSAPHQKKHKLINPVENLEDYICQKHERPLEWFCRDDQTCVCLFCTEGEHRTHNTVPLEEESQEKKTAVHQMTQDRIKKIKEIRHSLKLKMKNTKEEKSSSVELFTDLIRSIERCQSDQLKMMEEQQKAAEEQAEDLIKELHQEITELEQLSDTDDHLHLIQMCSSLDSRPHTENWTEIRNDSDVNVNSLHRALAQLKKSNQELKEKLNQTGLTWAQAYAVDVTLDPDTANPRLILSDDGKQVSRGDIEQDVPENPKRFSQGLRVLAKQGFSSGRFYYEVQVKGKTECFFGVARESINRNVTFTQSPDSGLWILSLKNENEFEPCDSTPVSLSLRKKPEKVGVFVDYEEGLVSFYNVESRSHIYSYTVQTFTDKLYPVFNPGQNGKGKGKNSNPLIITPVS